jgi:hypothetical protein
MYQTYNTSTIKYNLKKVAYKLHQIIAEYGLTISVENIQMAFKKRGTVRCIIETDNKITEQLIFFNFLGHLISHEKEMDIDNILNNYLKIIGTIHNVFRPYKTLKKTRLKLYYALALSSSVIR